MKAFIIIVCMALGCSLASAQSLTLDDCRQMAIEHNRNLKIAHEQRTIATDQVKVYQSNYLPKFSITGNYIYSTGSTTYTMPGGFLPTFTPNLMTGGLDPNILAIGPDGTPIFKEYAYMPDTKFDFEMGSIFTAGINAQQPIYLGGKIRSSVKMAKIGKAMAELNLESTQTSLMVTMDEAFFTCIKMEELVKSTLKYKELVSEFLRQLENAYGSGLKNKNDVLKVQVKFNEAELQLRRSQNGLRLARMNLCYHIGLSMVTDSFELVDDISSASQVESRKADISARPEYALLEQQIALKERNVALVRSDFLPQVVAMASYSYMNGIQLNNSNLFNKPSFMGGVSLNIPLFSWGEGRRKISAARHEVEIARYQFDDLSDQMQLELMQASHNYDEAVLMVDLSLNAVKQAEENMNESRLRYEVGMETLSDFLESQVLWQKSLSDLVEARSQQRITHTKYLKAAGLSKSNL